MKISEIVNILCAQHWIDACASISGPQMANLEGASESGSLQTSSKRGSLPAAEAYHLHGGNTHSSSMHSGTRENPSFASCHEGLRGIRRRHFAVIASLAYNVTRPSLFLTPAEVEAYCIRTLYQEPFSGNVKKYREHFLSLLHSKLNSSNRSGSESNSLPLKTFGKQHEVCKNRVGLVEEAALDPTSPCIQHSNPLASSSTISCNNLDGSSVKYKRERDDRGSVGRPIGNGCASLEIPTQSSGTQIMKGAETVSLEEQFSLERERDRAPYFVPGHDNGLGVGTPSVQQILPSAHNDKLPIITPFWSMQLNEEQRSFLYRLRNTPLSRETLMTLFQQFHLVEGNNVFFHDVQPETLVECSGRQAGPYRSVIASPLSLMTIKRCIDESRRQYDRNPELLPLSVLPYNAGQPTKEEGHTNQKMPHPSSSRQHTTPTNAVGGKNLQTFQSEENDSSRTLFQLCDYQLLTLTDLERMIWHTAANCVFFNAPETLFRPTATKFAMGCSAIIQQYCSQQLFQE